MGTRMRTFLTESMNYFYYSHVRSYLPEEFFGACHTPRDFLRAIYSFDEGTDILDVPVKRGVIRSRNSLYAIHFPPLCAVYVLTPGYKQIPWTRNREKSRAVGTWCRPCNYEA